MADNRAFGCNNNAANAANSRPRDAVCIDVNKVYDSCCDRDCLSDLRVQFTDAAQNVIDDANTVRFRRAEIINCCIDCEPLPFDRGCYSVDITFYFKVHLDVLTDTSCESTPVCGLATFNKKCILFGGEGTVKVFSSNCCTNDQNDNFSTSPIAKVQAAEPIALDAKICKPCECVECCCTCNLPNCVTKKFNGVFSNPSDVNAVSVTIGLFSIVQLEREVQILVPSSEFCIPTRECSCTDENPCDAFDRICFPTDEFFPKSKKCCN